jgi:Ca2+-binding RTX toxin-like protein
VTAANLLDGDLDAVENVSITNPNNAAYDFSVQNEDLAITGNTGNDTITGGLGNDTITGGSGNDSLSGGDGINSLSGGDGDDTFVVKGTDSVDGGAGTTDIVKFANSVSAFDFFDTDLVNVETIMLTNTGSATYDFSVQTEALTITGGTGVANITGGTGADTITGGTGADSITGGTGADSITGGSGADTLNGGDGADTITGGDGADSMTGGNGADIFVFAAGASGTPSDTVVDSISDYTSGTDIIDFGSTAITQGGDSTVAAVAGHADVDSGVVSFHADDDTLAERIIAVNDALDDMDNAGDTTDSVAGEALVFAFGADSYIYISDGVAGVGTNDVLIKLVGIAGGVGTDTLTIGAGDISALA